MKLNSYINKTALYVAVEKGNLDIINLLLGISGIDLNKENILKLLFL